MLQAILDFFGNPANYPILLGFLTFLRATGELLKAIAKRFNKPDLGGVGRGFLTAVEYLGKFFAWLGIGNAN